VEELEDVYGQKASPEGLMRRFQENWGAMDENGGTSFAADSACHDFRSDMERH
jgi:hypothetical protein